MNSIIKIIVSIFFVFAIAFSIQYSGILEPKENNKNIEKDFYTSINLLKNDKEDLGLKLLKKSILENPSQSRYLYKENMNNPLYTNLLHHDYGTCFDGMIFKSLVQKRHNIDIATMVLAVSYIFATSSTKMIEEHKKIIHLFQKYAKNNKVNLETLAIFEANLFMLENRPNEAYERLAKEVPYSLVSVAMLEEYSASTDIPLFKSPTKLLNAMKLKNTHLNPATIPYSANHFFSIDCKRI